MTTAPHQPTILLVEDNDDDVFIFRRAYRQSALTYSVQAVTDGEAAVEYLKGEGMYADRAKFPLPFLVLLDLKLPLKPGLEVLQTIRETAPLADLNVVVLTSSAEQRDIARAQELKARAYLVKPPSATALSAAVQAVRARIESGGDSPVKIPGDMFSTGTSLGRAS